MIFKLRYEVGNEKFLFGVLAVSSLALLIFSGTTGYALYAQDASNKLSMLEIVISNLMARVEALGKRVSTLEQKYLCWRFKSAKKEASIKESPKSSLTNGFEDIGNGFFVRNARFNPFGTNVLFTGDIANRSEKNYRFAKFTLEIYDDRDLLVKKKNLQSQTSLRTV